MYIGDYLARREVYSPEKVAVVDAGKNPIAQFTFSKLNERANRLANWLQMVAGVNKGDRVGILAYDGVEHLDSFFACSKIGAIHTALNWRFHWRENLKILLNTCPKVLIYSSEFSENVGSIQRSLQGNNNQINHYIHIGDVGLPGTVQIDEVIHQSSPASVFYDLVESEDIAALIFTGGTTGLPKGAQISHRMIAWNTLNTVIHDIHHDDVYLNVFPMFHTGGLFVYTLPQVIMGGKTILVKKKSSFYFSF